MSLASQISLAMTRIGTVVKTKADKVNAVFTGTTPTVNGIPIDLAYLPTLAPVRVASGLNPATLSGLYTLDGVALAAGDRVLVRWNGPASQNGIYVAAAGAWARAADADTAAKIQRGTKVMAMEGNADKWKIFTQVQTLTTLGTDNVEWRLHTHVDVAGSLQYPGPLNDGHLFWDRNAKTLVGWEGGWTRLNGTRICTSTTRPVFAGDDAVIYETDTGNSYILLSGVWKPFGAVVVEDQNATPREVSKLDFQGAGVGVSAGAAGEAVITIPGGGGAASGDNWIAGTGVPSGPNVVTRTNLCTNPSLEANTTDWSLIYSAISSTMTRLTTQARDGGWCLAETSASDSGGNLTMGVKTPVNVVAGTTYTASAYLRAATASRSGRIDIDWRNSLGGNISTTTGTLITSSSGAWSRWWVSGVAPAGAVTAFINVIWTGVAVSETHYLDSVLVEAVGATSLGTVGAYFDGATTDTSADIYDWLGTASNSVSTRSGPVPLGTWYEDIATRLVYEMTDASGVWTLRGGMNVTTEPDWGAYTNETGSGPSGTVTGTASKIAWPSAAFRGVGVTPTADNGLRVAKAGVYRLQSDLTIQSSNAGWLILEIRVYRAAVNVKTISIVGGNNINSGFSVSTFHAVTDLLAGDIVYVYATTSAAGTNAVDSRSQFTVHQIAASAATSGELTAGYRGTTAQSIPHASNTTVDLSAAPDHTSGGISIASNIVTVATAGVYQLQGSVQYNVMAASRVILRIEGWSGADPAVGSGTIIAENDVSNVVNNYPGLTCLTQMFLPAGYRFRLITYQASTVAVPFVGGGEPAKLNIRKISQGGALADTGWISMISPNILGSGWTAYLNGYESPAYKRVGNTVVLRGMLLRAAGAAASALTMPAGFRLPGFRQVPTLQWNGSATVASWFTAGTDGTLTPNLATNAATYSLDQITYDIL